MELTRSQLRRLITEMTRRPPHIPTTDPSIEKKLANLLTANAADVNQAVAMLDIIGLTRFVKSHSYTNDVISYNPYQKEETRITNYTFKVTQSFYDEIVAQLKLKRKYGGRQHLSTTIAEWDDDPLGSQMPQAGVSLPKIIISTPYSLLSSNKYRQVLRKDEPYVEVLQYEIRQVLNITKL